MKPNEYRCASCLTIYTKGWSDEEASKEAEENFGKPVSQWNDEAMVICDDCYQKMIPSEHPEELAKAKLHI